MAKKLIYIILGALLVFGLLFLAWSWFFGGSGTSTSNTGTFGTASSTNSNLSGGAGAQSGNGQTSLGNTTSNQTINIGNTNSGSGGTANSTTGSSTQSTLANLGGTSGVAWLGGTGSASAGSGSAFSPSQINSVSNGGGGSAPTITTTSSNGSNGLGLDTALIAAGVTGVAVCGAQQLAVALAAGTTLGATTAATVAGVQTANAVTSVPTNDKGSYAVLNAIAFNQTAQTSLKINQQTTSFTSCIVTTLAKAALQQITISIVQWINSGFNGQPGFVTNYNQFFTNTADAAAGQFIQGSGLAFLCSPFKLQIKIAVAQAYANRTAQSCTLTSIIKNVNNFMNGAFAQGGWQGFVSFATVPLNNPYGSYSYAQVSLGNAQANALLSAATGLTLGQGFLPVTKQQNCTPTPVPGTSGGVSYNCQTVIVTPGKTIADSITNTLKTGQDQLGLAKDFDDIISAFMTQMMTKTLYSGLTSVTAQTTTEDTASESQDASLLADMQNNIAIAQQLGSVYQGSIGDIENAQSALNTLANCWSNASSSTALSSAQTSLASQNAASAQAQIAQLQAQVDSLNEAIVGVNNEIAVLESFITQATSAASASDVQALAASYSAAQTAQPFVAQSDVTTAQQNRTTLQATLASTNQATASSQTQCNAFGQ